MRLTDKEFFEKAIDQNIPALAEATRFYKEGKQAEAEKAFADYLKTIFPDDRINGFPKSAIEGTGGVSEEQYAEEILEGYVYSVGFKYKFPDGIMDWTYNPTFNNYVEFTYHLQYHSELQILANAYTRTGDERYAKRFEYMLNSWIEQAECPDDAPGGTTKLWRTIEAGVRMAGKWPVILNAFIHSPSVADRTWVNMFKSVWEHGYRLTKNNTQRGHNNWIINEMVGLLAMGVCYPFMSDAKSWYDTAVRIATEEASIQILDDCMQAELTTGYQGSVIGNYLRMKTVLLAYGKEIPACFINGVRKMYSMYVQITKPNLKTPGLNDGIEADVVRAMTNATLHYPDDPVFKYFATYRKEGTPPEFLSRVFPQAGHVVMRTDWSENAIWAMVDLGPEGAAHIHEDKLAFQLYAYKEDMLPDTGTYAYDTSDMRRYVISTRSHNTGTVDGKGQNRIKTHVRGVIPPHDQKSDFRYALGDDYDIGEGWYDQGYGDELTDVKHTRKVIFFKKGLGGLSEFFLILDKFESRDGAEHNYEISYQLPHVPVSAYEHCVEATYKSGATMKMVSDKYPKLLIGQYAPEYAGWRPIHGPEEHEHAPAPLVAYAKRGMEAKFATVIAPFAGADNTRIGVELTENGFNISVDEEKFEFTNDDPRFATVNNLD